MNTHDIELPTLPAPGEAMSRWAYDETEMQAYARAAVAADRKRRGEPVAVIRFERNKPDSENEMPKVILCNRFPDGDYQVFLAPQPAEPTDEVAAMEAVMKSVDPATWPGLTAAQRCALGRFAKPAASAEPIHQFFDALDDALSKERASPWTGLKEGKFRDRMLAWDRVKKLRGQLLAAPVTKGDRHV